MYGGIRCRNRGDSASHGLDQSRIVLAILRGWFGGSGVKLPSVRQHHIRDGRNFRRTVRENSSRPRVAQTSSELCMEIRPDSRRRSDPTSLCEVRRHADYGRTIRHDGEQSVSRVRTPATGDERAGILAHLMRTPASGDGVPTKWQTLSRHL